MKLGLNLYVQFHQMVIQTGIPATALQKHTTLRGRLSTEVAVWSRVQHLTSKGWCYFRAPPPSHSPCLHTLWLVNSLQCRHDALTTRSTEIDSSKVYLSMQRRHGSFLFTVLSHLPTLCIHQGFIFHASLSSYVGKVSSQRRGGPEQP